jgi:sugar/nucleoside kinase (ribokinase family)
VYITVHGDGECSFFVTDGSNKKLCLDDFDCRAMFDCDLFLYQDLGAMPCLDPDCHRILQEAKDWGVKTIVDENNIRDLNLLKQALPCVDYFLPGLDAIQQLMPGKTPGQIVADLRGMGASTVVLKMGPAGCLVSSPQGEFSVPTMATKVVDTTGAGDCFDAGFIAGLADDRDLEQCVKIGSAAAAAVLAHVGGASGISAFGKLVETATSSN